MYEFWIEGRPEVLEPTAFLSTCRTVRPRHLASSGRAVPAFASRYCAGAIERAHCGARSVEKHMAPIAEA